MAENALEVEMAFGDRGDSPDCTEPRTIGFVDERRGHNFAKELAKRSAELQTAIRKFSTVTWPVIVREENFQLVDGYCRYDALRRMNTKRICAYVGRLQTNAQKPCSSP